jgi:hypothetical protein
VVQLLGGLPEGADPTEHADSEFELDLARCFGVADGGGRNVTVREVLCVASLMACSKWFTALSLSRVPLSSEGSVKILFNAIAANTVRAPLPSLSTHHKGTIYLGLPSTASSCINQ